jgi:AraC-like DNA-binding protein
MLDLVHAVRSDPTFDRLTIGDLLFAQYTCPLVEETVRIWASTDYIVHVLSGRRTWRTPSGSWTAGAGQTLFFKKGACLVEQHMEERFCVLLFFVPDAFVRSVVHELGSFAATARAPSEDIGPALPVDEDATLTAFFQSMRAYFSDGEKPHEALLRLKLQELIMGVLTGRKNPALAAYFRWMAAHRAPPLAPVMEANFRYNLSLDEFARLCHRSLSTFKREFRGHFGLAPGKWLHARRLEHAAALLKTTDLSVTEVVFECGFEDHSHFTKAFKEKFGHPPSAVRGAPVRT